MKNQHTLKVCHCQVSLLSQNKYSLKEITSQRDFLVTNNELSLVSLLITQHWCSIASTCAWFHHSPISFRKTNEIKSPLSICTALSSPSTAELQQPKGEQSSPRQFTQASRLCNADPPGLFPTPGDSFGGETDSQSEIFTSINANVVSSQMLSRSIFPPTFPCAPQNPPAAGSSGCSSTAHHVQLVCFNSVCNSCYPGNILVWKTSYTGTYSAANIAVVGI